MYSNDGWVLRFFPGLQLFDPFFGVATHLDVSKFPPWLVVWSIFYFP